MDVVKVCNLNCLVDLDKCDIDVEITLEERIVNLLLFF